MTYCDIFRVCSTCNFIHEEKLPSDKKAVCQCGRPIWSHTNLEVMKWVSTTKWWNPLSWGSGKWVQNGMGPR